MIGGALLCFFRYDNDKDVRHVRDCLQSSKSLEKGNSLQRGAGGGSKSHSYFLYSLGGVDFQINVLWIIMFCFFFQKNLSQTFWLVSLSPPVQLHGGLIGITFCLSVCLCCNLGAMLVPSWENNYTASDIFILTRQAESKSKDYYTVKKFYQYVECVI